MKTVRLVGITLAFAFICVSVAVADDAANAQALVEKAVAMVKEKGLDATLKAISDPKGPFVKGNLFAFAGSLDKVTLLAHPLDCSKLVGPDLSGLSDSKGNHFIARFNEVANNPGSGWVEYVWPKPGEQERALKRTFVMKVPNERAYIAAGYYVEKNDSGITR